MVVLLEVSPISTEELWSSVRVTIQFLVTSLNKAILPRLLSLARWPALGRVLVFPNFFHLRMIETTVFCGTFNAAEIIWYPSPDLCLDPILSRSSTDIYFTSTSCLGFCSDMHSQLWTLYIQVYRQVCLCAFPNHVQSTELTTGCLQIKLYKHLKDD